MECKNERGATSPCAFDSYCDSAAMRDQWQPSASTPMMIIRIGFVVLTDDGGSNEAVSSAKLNAQFAQLEEDFDDYNIGFLWVNQEDDYHVEETDFNRIDATCLAETPYDECICPLGDADCDPEEYAEAAMMEYGTAQTGLDASSSLNVFLSIEGDYDHRSPMV